MKTLEKIQILTQSIKGSQGKYLSYDVSMHSGSHYWVKRVLAEVECAIRASEAENGRYDGAIGAAVDGLYEYFKNNGAITKEAALSAEEALLPAAAAVKAYTVHCVAHAHIDMNWMWGFQETAAVTMDTFRTMLDLMKEYPKYTFSQSQASVYRIVEEYDPEMLEEIKARVKEGRWEVSASTWVEADKNMPNGESFARHALYTKRYLHDLLGVDMDGLTLDYEPDTFGHSWNIPEICSKAGVKYYYHHRAYDGHYVYRWQSRSGAELIVFRDPKGYGGDINSDHLPFSLQFCNDSGIKDMLLVYGVGDHGGGPTRRDIERIMDMGAWPVAPTVIFSKYEAFYKALEAVRESLPVVNQELNFVFTGCYTSQSRIKMSNRIAEDRLYDAEALSAMAAGFTGGKDNRASFAKAWEKTLFNQFHDIVTGSGVMDTREYALGEFQKVITAAGTNAKNAMYSIAGAVDTSDIETDPNMLLTAEGSGVGFEIGESKHFQFPHTERGRGKVRILHLFNPTEFCRDTPAAVTIWDWDYDVSRLSVKDSRGNPVKFQILEENKRIGSDFWGHKRLSLMIDASVPAFGYATYVVSEAALESLPKFGYLIGTQDYYNDGDKALENDLVKAVFKSGDMRLVSFIDKTTGQELMDCGSPSCAFRLINEDTIPGMTAWRVGRYAKITDLNAEGKVVIYEQNQGCLTQSIKYRIGFEQSSLDVTVSLDQHSKTLSFDISADWHEIGNINFMPQLNFYVPFAFNASQYRYDIPFGTIDRGPIHDDTPGNSFIMALPDEAGNKPLMLISDTKYGFRGANNSLAVALIRSSTEPDPSPEDGMHRIRLGVGIADSLCNQDVFCTSSAFIHPISVISGTAHKGDLPKEAGFLTLDGDVKCSAIKTAEDGDGLIVRLYDANGKGGAVTAGFMKPVRCAKLVDLTETKEVGAAEVLDGKAAFNLPAHQMATLKVSF